MSQSDLKNVFESMKEKFNNKTNNDKQNSKCMICLS